MTRSEGRFGREAMTGAMRQVARRLGVPSDDAELLRLTNNAVFALPRAGIVIRIIRSHTLHDRVHKVVALARWFEAIDAPTIRLAPDVDQPIAVGGVLASIWEYVPPADPAPELEDLGQVLRAFHALGVPPLSLPRWDPVADARARLADAEHLDDDARHFLQDWCDRLDPQLDDLRGRSRPGLVHGDAHVGNLLRQPDGRVALCDFDATCLGPWQVDLVAVPVGEIRFGRAGAHARLAAAYGYDVTNDPDWPLLREARELKMIAAAVPLLADPRVGAEFDRRRESITLDRDLAWTPFAQLAP